MMRGCSCHLALLFQLPQRRQLPPPCHPGHQPAPSMVLPPPSLADTSRGLATAAASRRLPRLVPPPAPAGKSPLCVAAPVGRHNSLPLIPVRGALPSPSGTGPKPALADTRTEEIATGTSQRRRHSRCRTDPPRTDVVRLPRALGRRHEQKKFMDSTLRHPVRPQQRAGRRHVI